MRSGSVQKGHGTCLGRSSEKPTHVEDRGCPGLALYAAIDEVKYTACTRSECHCTVILFCGPGLAAQVNDGDLFGAASAKCLVR